MTHTESEHHDWAITIPGHAPRTESKRYTHSRKVLRDLVAESVDGMYGVSDIEDHHGGALWAWELDDYLRGKAFFIRNICGIEWSAQFCLDPKKADLLRQNALRFYWGFPLSVIQLNKLGCEATTLLKTPIVDIGTIGDWVDSIFNASVPLPKTAHTGVLPNGAGTHHYPDPVQSIQYFKYDDFELWVNDPTGVPVAVVPIAPRGSGVADVAVIYAPKESVLHPEYATVRDEGKLLVLPAGHPLAEQAFSKQV